MLIVVAVAFADVNFNLLFSIFTSHYYQIMNAHYVDFVLAFISLQLTTLFDVAKWFQITWTCSRASKEVRIILWLSQFIHEICLYNIFRREKIILNCNFLENPIK